MDFSVDIFLLIVTNVKLIYLLLEHIAIWEKTGNVKINFVFPCALVTVCYIKYSMKNYLCVLT